MIAAVIAVALVLALGVGPRASLILLVAMIGAFVLTLNFYRTRKNELSSRQLSRTNDFLAFFKDRIVPYTTPKK